MNSRTDLNHNPIKRIFLLVKKEKVNINFLYGYAIFAGLISLATPLGIQAIVSFVMAGRLSSSWAIIVFLVALGVVLTGLTKLAQISILENIQRRLFAYFSFTFSKNLTAKNTVHLTYDAEDVSQKFYDVITVQKSFAKLLVDMTTGILMILFGLILLMFYHPLFIGFAAFVIVFIITILRLTWKRGIASARYESDYKFKTAHWLVHLSKNDLLYSYTNHNQFQIQKTDEYLSKYLKGRIEHFKVLYSQFKIALILKTSITVIMLVLGSWLLVNEDISLGQFLASEILILSLVNSIEKVIISTENIYDTSIALEKLSLASEIEDNEKETVYDTFLKNSDKIEITFINTQNAEDTLTIKQNDLVCLIGEPESGRTNILLSALGIKNSDYRVQYNSINAENITSIEMNEMLNICPQQGTLFKGTYLDNITLKEELNMPLINELLDALNLRKYAESLPDGLFAEIEKSKEIPESVVKKIVLARCLYLNSKILFIDDIWYSFTKKEQINIIDYLKKTDRTILLVSNHMPVIEKCDYVINVSKTETGMLELEKTTVQNLPISKLDCIWK